MLASAIGAPPSSFITGDYERRPVENPWHEGRISERIVDGKLVLEWSNKAGVSWYLYPDADRDVLQTGPRNPYLKNGAAEFQLVVRDGIVTAFEFNGGRYHHLGVQFRPATAVENAPEASRKDRTAPTTDHDTQPAWVWGLAILGLPALGWFLMELIGLAQVEGRRRAASRRNRLKFVSRLVPGGPLLMWFTGLVLLAIVEPTMSDVWEIAISLFFSIMGILVALIRRGVVIDTPGRKVTVWWGVLSPMTSRTVSLDSFGAVVVEKTEKKRESSAERPDRRCLVALRRLGENLHLRVFPDYSSAKAFATEISERLEIELADSAGSRGGSESAVKSGQCQGRKWAFFKNMVIGPVLLGAMVVFGVLGVGWSIQFGRQEWAKSSWTPVVATVTDTKIEKKRRKESNPDRVYSVYHVVGYYRYVVDGTVYADREFEVEQFSAKQSGAKDAHERARAKAAEYERGVEIEVHYDPEAPSRSAVEPAGGFRSNAISQTLIGIIVSLGFAIGGIYTFCGLKHHEFMVESP